MKKIFLLVITMFVAEAALWAANVVPPPAPLKTDALRAMWTWFEANRDAALERGRALNDFEIALARQAGVTNPERIRILVVPAIPVPEDPLLSSMTGAADLKSSANIGQTLEYAVLLREDSASDPALMIHEFTHVHQYEKLGGARGFLDRYMTEIAQYGYDRSPLELEALKAEKEYKAAHHRPS